MRNIIKISCMKLSTIKIKGIFKRKKDATTFILLSFHFICSYKILREETERKLCLISKFMWHDSNYTDTWIWTDGNDFQKQHSSTKMLVSNFLVCTYSVIFNYLFYFCNFNVCSGACSWSHDYSKYSMKKMLILKTINS